MVLVCPMVLGRVVFSLLICLLSFPFLVCCCVAIYLDGVLEELSNSGVGCNWDSSFVGALA